MQNRYDTIYFSETSAETQRPKRPWLKNGVAILAALALGNQYFNSGNSSDADWLSADQLSALIGTAPETAANNADPNSMVIASYNLLNIGASKEAGGPEWVERTDRAVGALVSKNVGVAGLQEVSPEQFNRIRETGDYDMFPKNFSDEEHSGVRPILWKPEKYKLVKGGHYRIGRYCTVTSMPWAELKGKDGNYFVFNLHSSSNGPQTKPCSQDTGGSPGADNDDGTITREQAADTLLETIKKTVPAGVDAYIVCDCNSANRLRKKDGKINKAQLPYYMFQKAGFASVADLATEDSRYNMDYNTSHGSLTKRVRNGLQIDHVFVRSKTARVIQYENFVGPATKGVSDHTPPIGTIIHD
jgi:hypothetical protein